MNIRYQRARAAMAALVTVAVFCIETPRALAASPADFTSCDGYGASTDGGDGMTTFATSLVIFNLPGNGNTARRKPARGASAAASCDAALAALQPQHWLRQVSLLRARAVHQLEDNNLAAGKADIDRAEALLHSHQDGLANGSMGVGLSAVQAFAFRASGEPAKAREIALTAAAVRPYSKTAPYLALMAVGPEGNATDIEGLIRQSSRLSPIFLNVLFDRYLREGRYAEAIELYPQLTFGRGFNQFKSPFEMKQLERGEGEVFWVRRGMQVAYALAASGKAADARAMVTKVNQRLEEAIKDPVELGGEPDKMQVAQRTLKVNTNLQIAAKTRQIIAAAGPLVDLRLMVLDGHAQDAMQKMQSMQVARNWMSVELLDAIGGALPTAQASAKAAAQAAREQLLKETQDFPSDTLDVIWRNLPPTEISKSFSPYKAAGVLGWLNPDPAVSKAFGAETEGYRSLPADKAGDILVRYRSHRSPSSMVEEMALLRAAELAHDAGKGGFVIVDRRDVPITLSVTQYGRILRTDPDGSETELQVEFLDPAAPPAAYAHADWRILRTDEVLRTLQPIYKREANR